MADEKKDIRFTQKKVDEAWKAQIHRNQGVGAKKEKATTDNPAKTHSQPTKTSKPFLNMMSSLAYQVMMHLGEIPNPTTQDQEKNLEAAREIIDVLNAIQEKTNGNLSSEEAEFFNSVLPELKMKFSSQV